VGSFKCKAGLSPPVLAAVPKHETRADNRRRLVANDSAIVQIYSPRPNFFVFAGRHAGSIAFQYAVPGPAPEGVDSASL